MGSPRLFPGTLALGVASLVLAPGAAALQHELSFSESAPLQPTDWSASLPFPRFDPALGILLEVRFELVGQAEGSASLESLNGSPSTVETSFGADVSLRRPDGSEIVLASPLASFSDDLTTFDGVIDFGGKSGRTHAGIAATDAGVAASTAPSSDLLLFTGDPGNPGMVALTLVATGGSAASGSGNLITQFQTSAGAEVTITYVYDLDCNANGVPDLEDIGKGASHDVTPDRIPDECQPAVESFCEGDGADDGGQDCPCGNEGSPGEGCDNGTGRGGLMTASGEPSTAADTLNLTAAQIPPTSPGFFFYSSQRTASGDPVVFGNGLMCLELGVLVAKTDGGGTVPSGSMPPLSFLLGIEPGDTCYFQYWYRNATGPCPGEALNATNALAVTYGL